MPASYPAGFDAMSDPSANLSGPPLHSTMHNQINDVIEAIEAELGLTPSGADATVAATLAALPSRYLSSTRRGGQWAGAAAQSIGVSTLTTINWTTEVTDTDGFLTPTSGNAVIPAGLAGIYAISATGLWASAPTGNNFMRIAAGGSTFDFSGNTVGQILGASAVVPLAVADTVVVQVFQTSAGAINIGTTKLFLHRIAL